LKNNFSGFLRTFDVPRIVEFERFADSVGTNIFVGCSRTGLKVFYRIFFDFAEEWTTLMADDILVNSHFTASVFKETFRYTVIDE
jgi:hypothetical protein